MEVVNDTNVPIVLDFCHCEARKARRGNLGRVFKFVIVGQRACARPSSARKRADLLEPKRVESEILKTRPSWIASTLRISQ